jgi:hypothetical protein
MRQLIFPAMLGLLAVVHTGCSGVRRVDAATFVQYGEATRKLNSATDYELVGVRDEKVFIRYWTSLTLGRNKTITYWIPLSELPAVIATELKAGRNPWGPTWRDQIPKPANQAPEPTR